MQQLHINPQFSLSNLVEQNPFAAKQQYGDAPVVQNEVPPRPPCEHIQPVPISLDLQHTCVDSEHPLKHKVSALLHDLPAVPQVIEPVVTLNDLLEYAPELPGKPIPQQHIFAPLPPAPQTSKTTAPAVGAHQQPQLHDTLYMPEVP